MANGRELLRKILLRKGVTLQEIQQVPTSIVDIMLKRFSEQEDRIRLLERSLEISSIEIRQYIQSLEQAQAAAIQSSKMAAVGEMSANISHEINNPLQIITGNTELIESYVTNYINQESISKEKQKDCNKLFDYTKSIQITVRRIMQIIRSLKRLSRSPAGMEYSQENIYKLLEDAVSIGRDALRRNQIQIEFLGSNDISAEVPSLELSQVFLNLMTNAKQAIHSISDIKERWIKVEVRNKDLENIEIIFSNGGPSIPTEIQDKIFEPFFTTKASSQGTGLGLSVSKKILNDMGGSIILDKTASNPRFILGFPKTKFEDLKV